MAIQLQVRRGNTAQNDAFTGAEGEITVDTSNGEIRVHDNVTPGGVVHSPVSPDGTLTKDVAGGIGDIILTAGEAAKTNHEYTGVLTGNRNIIVPDSVHNFTAKNSTTGTFTLTVKTAAGAGVIVQQGKTLHLYRDGVDVEDSTSAKAALTGSDAQEFAAKHLTLLEDVAPSIPASGHYVIYAKADGHIYGKDDAGVETKLSNDAATLLTDLITNVRQTVDYGPVDANGFAAFGGSTGTTTVTAAGTLYLTAANGINNRRGSITDPVWNNLNAFGDGVRPLYLDINPDGSCVTASAATLPAYQWGGTYSITNGQFTFNISEMTGKVGNGTVATQTYRVAAGEVVVSGGLVTSIVWYALMGRYDSGYISTLPSVSTQVSKSHNIGITPNDIRLLMKNTTAELGYSIGDVVEFSHTSDSTPILPKLTRNSTTCGFATAPSVAWYTLNKSTGVNGINTLANWSYKLTAHRGW